MHSSFSPYHWSTCQQKDKLAFQVNLPRRDRSCCFIGILPLTLFQTHKQDCLKVTERPATLSVQSMRTSNVHEEMMNCTGIWGAWLKQKKLASILLWCIHSKLCPEPPHCSLYSPLTRTLMFVKSQLVFPLLGQKQSHTSLPIYCSCRHLWKENTAVYCDLLWFQLCFPTGGSLISQIGLCFL